MEPIDTTLPGKSLGAQFDAVWQRFERLSHTEDTMRKSTARLRRWLTPVNVSFVIPIDDTAVFDYLGYAQQSLLTDLQFAPQPKDKLHITLYQVGYLRQTPLRIPGSWSRAELMHIVDRARQYLGLMQPFSVQIGPINAFPNVPIAEVHDNGSLRMLRGVIAQAIPPVLTPLNYPLIPHITLGYFGKQPAAPVRNALRPLRGLAPMSFTVDRVQLTLYSLKAGRHERSAVLLHSTEEVLASMPLGGTPD